MNDVLNILFEHIDYVRNNIVGSISPTIKEICDCVINFVNTMEVNDNEIKEDNT